MLNISNEDCMLLMARYPDKYFELAICDPPYGIGEDGSKNSSRGKVTNFGSKSKAITKSKEYKGFAGNDTKPMSKEFFVELKRVSVNQIIWGGNHFVENIPNANSPSWVVWDKVNGDSDFADCELALTTFKGAVRKFTYRWAGMLQEDMANKEIRIHPTQKPVALYKWLLDKYAKAGDKILDTHLGSGSIAIACHDYNFDLTACELDTDYYNAAMKRIANHTAQLKLF
jgi:site-specific DNA-methyltransferase (adenine-specific)